MAKKNNNKVYSQRQLRFSEQIRHILSNILLQRDFYDPRLQGFSITVSEVRISADLKNAVAYVFPLGGSENSEFVEALNEIAPQIGHMIAGELNSKSSPRISFKRDDVFDNVNKVEGILNSIKYDTA